MKTLVDLLLFFSAIGSVFFVAVLANVPTRVRMAVLTIPPSFFMAFLLHLRWARHLDWGLTAVGLSIIASALLGFQFIHDTPLSKEVRKQLLKRFGIICGLSALSAGLVTALVVNSQGEAIHQPTKTSAAPTSQTVAISDSTVRAIQEFNRKRDEK
ncbi:MULTISPECIES: hypothetical protein [unclassified Spirosoma]|uniref:hypothetical protein n=1 Tax=unclassified Spirosoma TaxID=2621999 RepID=UPI00095BE116|nr:MULTISPECIES: hypothetical protein [unclassified Spirosoma]MBN8825084.1 hypothetical protein [Spirosoma sp.]OJW77222.1 MAG: hypothetical protein BGO59_31715 [Spirosoma sp. 48-14]